MVKRDVPGIGDMGILLRTINLVSIDFESNLGIIRMRDNYEIV